jgi:hypothetical protein
MEVAVQTEKRQLSEKQREALRKGREEHHRAAKMYKEMLSQKQNEKVVENVVEEVVVKPVETAVPEKKTYSISFI